MFTHDPEEVQLWLNALPHNFSTTNGLAMSDVQQAVLQFLDNCISRFSKAQYKYTDQLVELVNTVNNEAIDKSTNILARTLIASNSDIGGSDYKHPFSPLLLTLCENLNFIKTDRTPATLYLTNLIRLLLTKQNVPYYLESVCSKLDKELDSVQSISPREVSKWNKNEMVLQARLCLDQKNVTVDSSKTVDQDFIENKLISLIKTENIENISECKEEFIKLLDQLPVSVLDLHLERTAVFCNQHLNWTSYEPIIDYLCLRHPLAGSIFDYTEIVNMKSFISMEQ